MADHHHHHHSKEDRHSHAHHAHGHGHGHDFASSNRQFFDDLASKYDERPLVKELCGSISQAFLKEYAFDKEKTRVLDFACGTGLISRNILPHSHQIIGVDISQGMLNAYTHNAESAGYSPEKIRATAIDLLKDNKTEATQEDIEQLGGKFDVIVCSMAYHHLPSIHTATRVLASLLNPGGALLVADIDSNTSPAPTDAETIFSSLTSPTPQPFHASNFFGDKKVEFKKEDVVSHAHGISLETTKEVFGQAGLGDVSVNRRVKAEGTTVGDVQGETTYIFVAKGAKV